MPRVLRSQGVEPGFQWWATGSRVLKRHDQPVIGAAGKAHQPPGPLLAVQRLAQRFGGGAGQLGAQLFAAHVQLAHALAGVQDIRKVLGHGITKDLHLIRAMYHLLSCNANTIQFRNDKPD